MPFRPDSITYIREQMAPRKKKRATRRALASELGCTEKTIVNWENGSNAPTFKMLDKIVELCQQQHIDCPAFYNPPTSLTNPLIIPLTPLTNPPLTPTNAPNSPPPINSLFFG